MDFPLTINLDLTIFSRETKLTIKLRSNFMSIYPNTGSAYCRHFSNYIFEKSL